MNNSKPFKYTQFYIESNFNPDWNYTAKQISKITGLGKNKLLKYFREINLLNEINHPTQFSVENNYVKIAIIPKTHHHSFPVASLTYEGILYLFEQLQKSNDYNYSSKSKDTS